MGLQAQMTLVTRQHLDRERCRVSLSDDRQGFRECLQAFPVGTEVNFHLLCADGMVNEGGMGSVNPGVRWK